MAFPDRKIKIAAEKVKKQPPYTYPTALRIET